MLHRKSGFELTRVKDGEFPACTAPDPQQWNRANAPALAKQIRASNAATLRRTSDSMRKVTQRDATPRHVILVASGLALAAMAPFRPPLAAAANADTGGKAADDRAGPAQSDTSRHDLKASDVLSSDVHDASGHYIGKAEDLLLDPASGRITAAIVAVKDFFGVSTKKIMIPIQDLKMSGDRQLTTTLDRQKLLAEKPAGE